MDEVSTVDAETPVVVAVVMAALAPAEEEGVLIVVTEAVAVEAEASVAIVEVASVAIVGVASVATVVVEATEEIEVEALAAAVVALKALESLGKCRLKVPSDAC